MRNPARIYPLLNKIGDYWVKYPDLRLGQIIESIKLNSNLKDTDLFYIEDDVFEKMLDAYLKDKKCQKR